MADDVVPDRPSFTEKQMAVGKEEFERRLAGLREYAYSDAHPALTRSIVWEVAYVDGLLAEVERLRAALQSLVDANELWLDCDGDTDVLAAAIEATEAAQAVAVAALTGGET